MTNFDKVVNRRGTGSLKWDVGETELPMWVADMDFMTAPCITEAIARKAKSGVFGYQIVPDEWYDSIINWWQTRHDFTIDKDWLCFATGVVPAITSSVKRLTNVGDDVVVMTPVYDIFFHPTKFEASVDIDVRLGVDPRKANQMVRGVVSLPNGTGKVTRVLALCTPDQEAAAKEAGADYVGLDEYIDKIKQGWTDVDVIITMPSCMGKLGPLGRILGPRGLMPNPKSGTVTMDVAKAVKEVKQGKIDFKVDKAGIVHTSIGKVTFTADQIFENAKEFISTIIKLKPAAAKGTYLKSIFVSSTMSKGIKVDPKSVE